MVVAGAVISELLGPVDAGAELTSLYISIRRGCPCRSDKFKVCKEMLVSDREVPSV